MIADKIWSVRRRRHGECYLCSDHMYFLDTNDLAVGSHFHVLQHPRLPAQKIGQRLTTKERIKKRTPIIQKLREEVTHAAAFRSHRFPLRSVQFIATTIG